MVSNFPNEFGYILQYNNRIIIAFKKLFREKFDADLVIYAKKRSSNAGKKIVFKILIHTYNIHE